MHHTFGVYSDDRDIVRSRRSRMTAKQITNHTAGRVRSGGGSAYYKNCDAARAAGAAPVHAGDPGYSRKLDRDGDGVGCE